MAEDDSPNYTFTITPIDKWFIPFFIGFQPSKVMQDFATTHSISNIYIRYNLLKYPDHIHILKYSDIFHYHILWSHIYIYPIIYPLIYIYMYIYTHDEYPVI